MGLKRINDTQGHQAGDELLLRAAACLRRHFDEDELFRIGGDEFLVLFGGNDKEIFLQKIEALRADMVESRARMALGYVWAMDTKGGLDYLMSLADEEMYKEKRDFYTNNENAADVNA
jgi:diguanylate cyclase (GGDEF)-like protein